mmetsp:Transcript_23513/g.55813  ORF Transcript_23513/g.55813 Transcript_23513/m.55813 type:complete len:284 (-) Transcript_23513:978-1829(-)
MVGPEQVGVEAAPVPHHEDVGMLQLHLRELRVVGDQVHGFVVQQNIDPHPAVRRGFEQGGHLGVRHIPQLRSFTHQLGIGTQKEAQDKDLMLGQQDGLSHRAQDGAAVDEVPAQTAPQQVPIPLLGRRWQPRRREGAVPLLRRARRELRRDRDGIAPALGARLPASGVLVVKGKLQDPAGALHEHVVLLVPEEREARVEEEHVLGVAVHQRGEEGNAVLPEHQPSLLQTPRHTQLQAAVAAEAAEGAPLTPPVHEVILGALVAAHQAATFLVRLRGVEVRGHT